MTLVDADRDFVRDLALRRAAIVLDAAKDYLIDSRLETLARTDGFDDGSAVVAAARRAPSGPVASRIVEAMTTNETSFFRDRAPFDALRHHVLPDLIAARARRRRLRIWCAASSSGQEPYSIAIVLREHFPQLNDWDIRIVGTDVSAEMVERARSGAYSQMEVGRGLPTPMLVRWFEQDGARWRVREDIRRLVSFAEFNLAGTWPPPLPDPDLVFLRNVMIYFDASTKATILRNVARMLPPDGSLFLGAGESLIGSDVDLVRVDHGGTCTYRRPESAAGAPSTGAPSTGVPSTGAPAPFTSTPRPLTAPTTGGFR